MSRPRWFLNAALYSSTPAAASAAILCSERSFLAPASNSANPGVVRGLQAASAKASRTSGSVTYDPKLYSCDLDQILRSSRRVST